MTRNKVPFALSLLLTVLMGCHSDAPKAPAAQPDATVSPRPTNANPDPSNQDCAAISDAALAEDCRFRKEVQAAKKKHNSDPAVKHSPGSIQQP
jgi:hypothetical protein